MNLKFKLFYSAVLLTTLGVDTSFAAPAAGTAGADQLMGSVAKGLEKVIGNFGAKDSGSDAGGFGSGSSGLAALQNLTASGGAAGQAAKSAAASGGGVVQNFYITDARQTQIYDKDGNALKLNAAGKPVDEKGKLVDPRAVFNENGDVVDLSAPSAPQMSTEEIVKKQWKEDPTLVSIDQMLYKSVPQEEADQIRKALSEKWGLQAQAEQQQKTLEEKRRQYEEQQVKAQSDEEARKRAQGLAEEINALEQENAALEDKIARVKAGQLSPDDVQGALGSAAPAVPSAPASTPAPAPVSAPASKVAPPAASGFGDFGGGDFGSWGK